MFTKLITEFDAKRFYDEINPFEVELAKRYLLDAIIEQRVIDSSSVKEAMRLTTHHLLIPNRPSIFQNKVPFQDLENTKCPIA